MALPPLKIPIVADDSKFNATLAVTQKNLKRFAAAAGAATAGVTVALAAMTRAGMVAVDANVKLARSLDGTANGLRAVQIAAGYSGVSIGEANGAMQRLSRELVRAREEGTPAADALARLGLTADQLSRLDVDERIATISDRMVGLGLSSSEASDMLRDLGVRSTNLALLLTAGGDAIRSARQEVSAFGLELSVNQTSAIEAANDSMARMGLVFEGLRNQLAAEMSPALQNVADRFNQIARSEAAQNAIARLVEAFSALSDILLTEDFIGTAAGALAGLANAAASVADGMVTVANNVEAVTLVMSGLTIAVAALGGPITLVAAGLAASLGAIAVWRSRGTDAAIGIDAAAEATRALNKALGVFSDTNSPDAARAAVELTNENIRLSRSAIAAAEAELALANASAEAARQARVAADAKTGPRQFSSAADARSAAMEEARANREQADAVVRLADAQERLNNAISAQRSAVSLITGADTFTPDGRQPDNGEESDPLQQQLDALTSYNATAESLAQAHESAMAGIRSAGAETSFGIVAGSLKGLLGAIGDHNKKAFAALKVAAQAEATVNAFRAASQVLANPLDFTPGQKIAAYTGILTAGLGLAASIGGLSANGGSGGGGGGGGSVAAAAPAAAAQAPTQEAVFNIRGDVIGIQSFEEIAKGLNDLAARGVRITNFRVAR